MHVPELIATRLPNSASRITSCWSGVSKFGSPFDSNVSLCIADWCAAEQPDSGCPTHASLISTSHAVQQTAAGDLVTSQLIRMISAFVNVEAHLDEKESQCRQGPVVRSLRQPKSIKDVASVGLLHVAQPRHMSPMAISPHRCTAILLLQNHWQPCIHAFQKGNKDA